MKYPHLMFEVQVPDATGRLRRKLLSGDAILDDRWLSYQAECKRIGLIATEERCIREFVKHYNGREIK